MLLINKSASVEKNVHTEDGGGAGEVHPGQLPLKGTVMAHPVPYRDSEPERGPVSPFKDNTAENGIPREVQQSPPLK